MIGTGEPRPDLVQRLKEKYQFLKVPERFEELYPSAPVPVSFQGGRFRIDKREVGIAMLQFIPGMMLVDTQSSTDDADSIIDDYIATANAPRPETITVTGPSYYVSQIEFSMEKPPDPSPRFTDAARMMDRFLADYGTKLPMYGPWGVTLNVDAKNLGVMAPAFFNLERRVGFSFEQKVFFSQAPLRTKDHLIVLEKLDSIIH